MTLPTQLLTSKLFIPPLRPSLVPRPHLVQLLNDGLSTERKLTLVSAPAGFGKTTLVVDWLKQIDVPAAWLSLDEADNGLSRFLAYLAAAFQQVDEEMGTSLLSAVQSPQLPQLIRSDRPAQRDRARSAPLILVLDDYHLLTDTAILECGAVFARSPASATPPGADDTRRP
jgi:LuxR family maltose regulon positive regulatory protein